MSGVKGLWSRDFTITSGTRLKFATVENVYFCQQIYQTPNEEKGELDKQSDELR